MTKFAPFDITAPVDSVDGWLTARGLIVGHRDFQSGSWLRFWRGEAAKALRRQTPTGVVLQRGQRSRDACIAALFSRAESGDHDGFIPCGICGVLVAPPIADVDHIVPLIRGGRHHIDNLQLAHKQCNQFKRTQITVPPADARRALLDWARRRNYSDTSWIVQEILNYEEAPT
jgi:hypothetical protein